MPSWTVKIINLCFGNVTKGTVYIYVFTCTVHVFVWFTYQQVIPVDWNTCGSFGELEIAAIFCSPKLPVQLNVSITLWEHRKCFLSLK